MRKLNARILFFPMRGQKTKIVRMADVLERTPQKWKRAKYLDGRKVALEKRLEKLGFTEARIALEVADLGQALRDELRWRKGCRVGDANTIAAQKTEEGRRAIAKAEGMVSAVDRSLDERDRQRIASSEATASRKKRAADRKASEAFGELSCDETAGRAADG